MDFEGVDKHSNQKVAGRFEVLGVLENQAVLVERDGRYNAVTHQLDKLRLKHADWREITAQGLEDILYREGPKGNL